MWTYIALAWRNIWRNRRRTLITIFAIMFAVVVSIFSQSLNRGSHDVMIDNMVRYNTGYLQLQDYRFDDEPSLDNTFAFDETLKKRAKNADPRIEMVLPRIETFMLAANGQSTRGAMLSGIDLEKEHRFNALRDRKTNGRFFEPGEQAAVLGKGLADRLGLGVGDTLALIGQGRFGMSASGLFEVVGIVAHPIREINEQAAYLPLETAQALLSAEGYITALLFALHHARHTESAAESLREEFQGEDVKVFTWPELMPELLDFIRFDMAGAYLMSAILYVVIGFGFFGTVLTMTMERRREFGVLIAIGMKRLRLAFVVFLETLCISIIGVLSGLGAALAVLYYFHRYPITLSGDAAEAIIEMGWDPVLPVSFAPGLFYTQSIVVFFISMVIFLYPLVKIAWMDVLEAARS